MRILTFLTVLCVSLGAMIWSAAPPYHPAGISLSRMTQPARDIGPIVREPFVAGPGHWQIQGNELGVPGEWVIELVVGIELAPASVEGFGGLEASRRRVVHVCGFRGGASARSVSRNHPSG